MSKTEQLEELITKEVIPDIEDAMDEIFALVADKKSSPEDEQELEEYREFKTELEEILMDIQSGEIEDDECGEIIEEIMQAREEAEGQIEEDEK